MQSVLATDFYGGIIESAITAKTVVRCSVERINDWW